MNLNFNWKDIRIPIAECMILSSIISSIIFSFYLFFYANNHNLSFFVALWAPTLMGFINYINLKFKR
jgi:hypothetical protein